MKIDHSKPTTVYTTYIASTPETVWEALTSATFSRKSIFRPLGGGRVENRRRLYGPHPGGFSSHQRRGRSNAIPPRKLTYHLERQLAGADEKLRQTLVTYEIEPAGDAVRLTNDRGA